MITMPLPPPREVPKLLSREYLEAGGLRAEAGRDGRSNAFWSEKQLNASRLEIMAQFHSDEEIWIFGYGSLIWNPIFPVVDRRIATVSGFHRSFCLQSYIGRGTADFPGLMLGLDAGGACTGVALKLGGANIEHELQLLWRREMMAGSYIPRKVRARDRDGDFQALTFVANRQASNYVGRQPDELAAARLISATGAIGSNFDYLVRTVEGLAAHDIRDKRLSQLLDLCQAAKLARDECET
jgi:glutathione-specific gamma-glutamylcyclotransferase